MQTTTQRWVPSLIMLAVTMIILALFVKQAALLFWIVAMLAMILALILAFQQQPRSWWTVLTGVVTFILSASIMWLIVKSTNA